MISNRFILYMTGLVIIGMAILFALNVSIIVSEQGGPQTYLKFNDVRGMAVKYKQLLYTLNFSQQNEIIEILNQSIPMLSSDASGFRQAPDIQQIIIYQFGNKPDLILTPIVYMNNQLIYSMPQWNAKNNLMELSNGRLQTLLSETYDH